MHLQENSYLTFDLRVKVTRNVAQYPLHHVTIYSATKFEDATSNSLGGDTLTRKVTDGRTDGQTEKTDFGTKLIYHFSKEKKRV